MKKRKILIVTDSFKGSLSSFEAATAVKKGIQNRSDEYEIEKLPIADGGEGTVEAIIKSSEGNIRSLAVKDPLQRDIISNYGWIEENKTAVIEVAAASGITLLTRNEMDPMRATSFGTGQLIKEALKNRSREIIIGLGGSATNDGGIGIASAIGVKFLDSGGFQIGLKPKNLQRLHSIDLSSLSESLKRVKITALCDVTNPLTGHKGATNIYGPQKGASENDLKFLEASLTHLANITEKKLGKEFRNYPGAGAAGGIGFAMLAFLNAELINGFEYISRFLNLEEKIKEADIVITGEGKLDDQSLNNKVPYGVSLLSRKHNKRVICLAGEIDDHSEIIKGGYFEEIFSITGIGIKREESKNKAFDSLQALCEKEFHNIVGKS